MIWSISLLAIVVYMLIALRVGDEGDIEDPTEDIYK